MAPLVIALLISVGLILGGAQHEMASDWPLWSLSVLSGLLIWRTRIHLLWLLALGAVLGWFNLI
jgi:chromate transporter